MVRGPLLSTQLTAVGAVEEGGVAALGRPRDGEGVALGNPKDGEVKVGKLLMCSLFTGEKEKGEKYVCDKQNKVCDKT